MKGIILAGGLGSRLRPMTKFINKHLINVYDKPMLYYSIYTLKNLGIKDILIISDKRTIINLKKNLTFKKINLSYAVQKNYDGIGAAMKESISFIKNSNQNIYILGDNFFYGKNFIKNIKKNIKKNSGATIFLCKTSNPSQYGVAKIRNTNITKLIEKPKKTNDGLAITGLYVFNKQLIKILPKIKKSNRGELEIISILSEYYKQNTLDFTILKNKIFWKDMGTIDDLLKVANFIKLKKTKDKFII